jgi:preprotein translocase subunit SecE
MSQKFETSPVDSGKDRLVWGLIGLLLAASLAANYYYVDFPWALRATGWILVSIIVIVLALFTAKGQEIKAFSKEARIELRKVVWPTRQETVQSTMVVAVMVIITALLLWGIDSVLMYLIATFTG